MSITITKLGPEDGETASVNPVLRAEVDSESDSDLDVRFYGKRRFDADVALRFVTVNDGHYNHSNNGSSDNPDDSPFPEVHDLAVSKVEELHQEREIDFLAHLGDIVHDDVDVHQDVIDNFFSELPCPYHAVYGNHDFATDEDWQNYYGEDRRYTFEYGDYGFVCTNTGGSSTSSSTSDADANWIEDQIDGFQDKQWVFILQHVDPLVRADMPDVRQQVARDEVAMMIHGHDHNWNFARFNNDGKEMYTGSARLGGNVGSGTDEPNLDDWGLRVTEVYEDGTVHTWQEPLNLSDPLNEDIEYDAEDGFDLIGSFTNVSSGTAVEYEWRSIPANRRHYWYVEAEEV